MFYDHKQMDALYSLGEVIENSDGIITDNDGVTYPLTPVCAYDYVRSVLLLAGENIHSFASMRDAISAAFDIRANFSMTGYEVFGKMTNLPAEVIHQRLHAKLRTTLIKKDPTWASAFNNIDKPMVMLTHGSKEWATRVVEAVGIALKFSIENDNILALEDIGYKYKNKEETPFNFALNKLNQLRQRPGQMPARKAIMLEDSSSNLRIPRDMGIRTILIKPKLAPDDKADPNAHFVVSSPAVLEIAQRFFRDPNSDYPLRPTNGNAQIIIKQNSVLVA